MIGILIVAHDPVAGSLVEAIRHVLGNVPPQLAALDVARDAMPEAVLERAQNLVAQLDGGDGVLVCSDICGATPCNVATRLSQPGKVHVLSGLNLPMLLRAINYRTLGLDELTEKAAEGARNGVMRMERNDAATKN
jgi:mannose PTS system EIIA component